MYRWEQMSRKAEAKVNRSHISDLCGLKINTAVLLTENRQRWHNVLLTAYPVMAHPHWRRHFVAIDLKPVHTVAEK